MGETLPRPSKGTVSARSNLASSYNGMMITLISLLNIPIPQERKILIERKMKFEWYYYHYWIASGKRDEERVNGRFRFSRIVIESGNGNRYLLIDCLCANSVFSQVEWPLF